MIDESNILVARNADGVDYAEIWRIVNNEPLMISRIDSVENGGNHNRINLPCLDEKSQYAFYSKGYFDTVDYTLFDADMVFVKLYN